MAHLLLVTGDSKKTTSLQASLARHGFACSVASFDNPPYAAPQASPDLVLAEIDGRHNAPVWALVTSLKKEKNLPVIALLTEEMLASLDTRPEADDFLVSPYRDTELLLRINRLLRRADNSDNSELIKCNGLTIDLATCEVTVDGKKADLTFKEYELLKLLAGNRGRVFTREVLLNKIWGYDYFGGDRTVDVHIRRLRSKIEDAVHTYIETVRNIGYKFIKNP